MEEGIVRKKWFLYLTGFFAGMSVMAVELGASRLLAPYFSSSQIVWTIIIAVIMIAMAAGNVWGGRAADRNPDPGRLYGRLLIAAVWIAAIPSVGKFVILGVTGITVAALRQNYLVSSAFLACLLIFVFPCFLLGTCTPSLARYTVTGKEVSGRTVGALEAFNTAGSIIGTFVPTFVTIPNVGTSATFIIFSCVLLVLAAVYFLSAGRRRWGTAMAAVLILLFSAAGTRSGFAFWEDDLLYEGESVYNYLQVREDEENVILSTNVLFGVQSVLKKNGGLSGMYYDYALAAPLLAGARERKRGAGAASDGNAAEGAAAAGNAVKSAAADGNATEGAAGAGKAAEGPDAGDGAAEGVSVLILGNGTGTFARQCGEYFEVSGIRGVEIDGKITMLGRKYFEMPEEIKISSLDGRAFIDLDDGLYDVIMVDAYRDITIPFQMSSREFFESVRRHLLPGGVMVVNMNMKTDEPKGINACLSDTIASVFPCVSCADIEWSTNRILLASGKAVGGGELREVAGRLSDPALSSLMFRVADRLRPYEAGDLLLTDDKAPVELLGMKALDGIIDAEVTYYRDVFREGGFSALLREMQG